MPDNALRVSHRRALQPSRVEIDSHSQRLAFLQIRLSKNGSPRSSRRTAADRVSAYGSACPFFRRCKRSIACQTLTHFNSCKPKHSYGSSLRFAVATWSQFRRHGSNGFDNVLVTRAATKVRRQQLDQIFFGVIRMLLERSDDQHEKTGRTKTAL